MGFEQGVLFELTECQATSEYELFSANEIKKLQIEANVS